MDFLVYDAKPGAYDVELRERGAKIFRYRKDRHPLRHFLNFRALVRHCEPYDIVHTHIDYLGGLLALYARALGVPIRVAHSHSDARRMVRGAHLARRIYAGLMKLMVRRFSTAGLGVSSAAAASLFGESWQSDRRWQVHTACVDLQRFHEYADRPAVCAELGISPDSLVFGHVGRFVEEKNHRFIIDIAEVLATKERCARFLLIGGGPDQRKVEKLIHERGLEDRFVILQPRDDVPRLMLGVFDFFLFPSHSEGLGLALVEAQAAGLRCFASTAVPPEAVVVPALVQQLPLSAGPEYWAEAILQQIDTPSPVTQKEALGRVEKVFDIRRNAAQLVEFYQTVTS
jgi:glycosyltransferase involved in cell wall biosynthesis